MRKLRSFYLSFLAVASLGLMTSCGDDSEDPKPAPAPKEMTTYSARIMGNQNNTTSGSFLSATDGVVRNSADAKANAGKIDLIYYHSSPASGDAVAAAQAATLASPTDAKAQEIYNGATNGLQTWATKNATSFKYIGSNELIFANIENGDDVADTYTSSTTPASSSVSQLKVNDVVAFVTSTGKHGVAKITAVTVNPTATPFSTELRMDVKMEL